MIPPLPDPDDNDPPPTAAARNTATYFAVALLLAVAVGLAAFVGMVFPTGFAVLAVILAASGLFLFHYLIWGRWLSRRLREDGAVQKQRDRG